MSEVIFLAAQTSEVAALAQGTGPTIPWGRIVLAFLFCVVIAVAAILFIRKRNGMSLVPEEWRARLSNGDADPSSGTKKLQITQRVNVTPTSQLVILTRGKKNYILHLTNSSATEIDRFTDDEEGADA